MRQKGRYRSPLEDNVVKPQVKGQTKKTEKLLYGCRAIQVRGKMNKKLVCAVIAAVVVIGLTAGCVEEEPAETPTPELTPTPEMTHPEETSTPTSAPTATPAMAAAISCDMCHKRVATVELAAHVEGGQSCMGTSLGSCHSAEKYGGPDADVHTVHPPEVTCRQCHIVDGELVVPETGTFSSCEMCHGYPNPLDPSEGRLVEIHLDRGRDCQVCHVGEISEVHGRVM
jgi:hypothetical protein